MGQGEAQDPHFSAKMGEPHPPEPLSKFFWGYRLDIHLTPLCHQPALQSHPCVDIDGCYPWPHILFNSSSVSSNLSEGDRTMFNDHQACISIFIKSFTSFSSSAFSFSSAGSTTTTWPFNRCVSTLAKGNMDTSMMSDEAK